MTIRNYRPSASFILDYSHMLYGKIAQQSISPGSKSQETTIYQATYHNLELLCCLLSISLGLSKISLETRIILFKKVIRTTYLKTNAANNYVYRYHDNAKEKCRVLTIMNKVIDIDDIFKSEQWYRLTKSQANDIYKMYTVNSIDFNCVTHNTSLHDVLHNAHKNRKATVNKLLKKS